MTLLRLRRKFLNLNDKFFLEFSHVSTLSQSLLVKLFQIFFSILFLKFNLKHNSCLIKYIFRLMRGVIECNTSDMT